MTELKKITSKNGHVYLFKDIQHKQRNELGIASGQSVLISIFEPDPFYFTEDIQLIHYKDIVKTESVSSKENEFFEYVKQNSPVAYKKKISDSYSISEYINYAPQLKFKYIIKDNILTITGEVKDRNVNFPISQPYVYVDKPENEIPLDNNLKFQYVVNDFDIHAPEYKISFILGTSKAEYGRSFNMKNFEGVLRTPSEISSMKAKKKK